MYNLGPIPEIESGEMTVEEYEVILEEQFNEEEIRLLREFI